MTARVVALLIGAILLASVAACSAPAPTAVPASPTPTVTPPPTPTVRPATPTPAIKKIATLIPSSEAVNRIAFVGADNQIYTVDPDGTDLRRVSPEPAGPGVLAGYTWPAWSPDARSLFMSAIVADTNARTTGNVAYVANEASPELDAIRIHSDERGSQGILTGVIHYPLWSPDGRDVVVLASTAQQLVAYLARADGSFSSPFFGGAPMYVAWSGDSESLYLHQADRLLRFRFEPGFTSEFIGRSTLYQAPAVTDGPDERVAFLDDTGEDVADLVVVEADGDRRSVLLQVTSRTAMQWSPDATMLAVTISEHQTSLSYRELLVADPDAESVRSLYQGQVFAFHWSPDSRRILIADLHPDRIDAYRWSVIDVVTGQIVNLGDWRPTGEFGQMLAFFDQFAKSHRLWSPDGRYVVLPGEPLSADSNTTPGDVQEDLWVIDTTGDQAPRIVGSGFLAFWSPL